MSTHMFADGEAVHYHSKSFECSSTLFHVVRQLPADNSGWLHYLIRNDDGDEQEVNETQLSSAVHAWNEPELQ